MAIDKCVLYLLNVFCMLLMEEPIGKRICSCCYLRMSQPEAIKKVVAIKICENDYRVFAGVPFVEARNDK